MKINVPDAIKPMENSLAEFFDGMVFKLNVNSHKDGLTSSDIPKLIDLMLGELTEFRDQLALDPNDMNVLAETWDGANFWFLIYAFLRKQGVATMRERFLEEYFDIVPDQGKVFCVKKRSGSKYGPGDEVLGSKNAKGEVMIRTQTAAGGFAVTLPRSHLIWWKATGVWPERLLHMGDNDNDCIENLFEPIEDTEGVNLPFVSRFAPSGREGATNYGKWVYQRRHMFQLVRVGYYNTQYEAAEEGLKAWKARVAEIQENKTC